MINISEVLIVKLNDAIRIPSVDFLFKKVDSYGSLNLIQAEDNDYWTSKTIDGVTTITLGDTKNFAAALTHELLHANLKKDGYKAYVTVTSLELFEMQNLTPILVMLDNELQHHKFYDEFISMGFNAEHFYHDNDVHTFKKIRREIDKANKNTPNEFFLNWFITLIARGGHGSDVQIKQLRNYLELRCKPDFWVILLKIEQIIVEWRAQATLDPITYIISIVQLLNNYNQSWIGSSINFPHDGRFVKEVFTEDQVVKAHANRQAAGSF